VDDVDAEVDTDADVDADDYFISKLSLFTQKCSYMIHDIATGK
jgi:hypothetical protein